MTIKEKLRTRFLRDSLPRRLGGLATTLDGKKKGESNCVSRKLLLENQREFSL